MRKLVLFALIAGLAFLTASCSKQGQQPTVPQSHEAALQQAQTAPWKIAFATEPAEPTYGQNTTFRATVTDETGKPVTGADVKADLKMRTMDMGKNEVTLADKGNGVYEGTGKFGMAGPWDVQVTATSGGKSATQTFPLVAKK